MAKVEEGHFNQAVLLIWTTAQAISRRRKIEKACGYPSEYGDDEFLLERLKEFLALPSIAIRAEKLVSLIVDK